MLKVTQAHKWAAKMQTQKHPRFGLSALNCHCIEVILSAFSSFRPGFIKGSYLLLDGWPLGSWSLAFQEVQKCMLTVVYSCPKVTCLKTPRSLHKTIQKDFTIAHPIKLISLWENVSEGGDSTWLCIQVGGHNRWSCPVILDTLTYWQPRSITLSWVWDSLPILAQNSYAS